MRLLRIHPESLVADTTHGTNKEKKDLFTIAGVDGNNNCFNALCGYIPSLQTWAFQLLFNQVITIHPPRQNNFEDDKIAPN